MWTLQPEAEYEKKVKAWPKKHHRELLAMYDNLDTLLTALNRGAKVGSFKFGFMHPEPRGVIAIDQKGGGPGLKETRLYTYPRSALQVLYLITVGDKSTQKADIQYASQFVDGLQPRKAGSNG
jgi:putative component of toxin-antitoxin plasmid stabilization module